MTKKNATHYHAQMGLPDFGHAINGLVVYWVTQHLLGESIGRFLRPRVYVSKCVERSRTRSDNKPPHHNLFRLGMHAPDCIQYLSGGSTKDLSILRYARP